MITDLTLPGAHRFASRKLADQAFPSITGLVVAGATAGTVQLRGRKQADTDTTSPTDDTTIYAGSHLRAVRVP